MSVILGIEKLQTQLGKDETDKLEEAAQIHQSQSNIIFCILAVEDSTIQIETTQSENRSGRYASEATLIKRTHEVFDNALPQYDVQVIPAPFLPSPTSVVTTAWLEKMMDSKGVRIKQLAFDTGVDRDSIAGWVSGKRSMSQIVKAMFYFYFTR